MESPKTPVTQFVTASGRKLKLSQAQGYSMPPENALGQRLVQRRRLLFIGVVTAAASLCVIGVAVFLAIHFGAPKQHGRSSKPSFVFIMLDDTDHMMGGTSRMPHLDQVLGQQGANFSNYFVNAGVCCPSRVTFLTGRCVHNHGVIWNGGRLGAEHRFMETGKEGDTLPVWLKDAGYDTALMGKYLNGYGFSPGVKPYRVPPGWDEWFAFTKIGYYNWTASYNGVGMHFGKGARSYSTDALGRIALNFLRSRKGKDQPFLLYLAPYASHTPAIPAPRHLGKLAGIQVPRTPSYNGMGGGNAGRASGLREYPEIQQKYLDLMDKLYESRAETLLAVDELLPAITSQLADSGWLDNTYIFLTSDNGYHLSHHRQAGAKSGPYEEDVHLPLFVRGPGIPGGLTLPHVVGNIDLAPTIADLAGVTGKEMDGVSFAPLLRNESARAASPDTFRAGFLLEKLFDDLHPAFVSSQIVAPDPDLLADFRSKPDNPTLQPMNAQHFQNNTVNKGAWLDPQGSGLVLYPPKGIQGDGVAAEGGPFFASRYGFNQTDFAHAIGFSFPGTFYGLRLVHQKLGSLLFLDLNGQGFELYNMTVDPYQIDNIYGRTAPAMALGLQSVLNKFKGCRGRSCLIDVDAIKPLLQ